MSVATSDIKFYQAADNNDGDGNGGRIGTTEISDSVINNLFPNVENDDRVAGKTIFRKFFMRNENSSDLALQVAFVFIGSRSTSDDYFQLHTGTDTDIQSSADDYTDWAGAGTLASAAASGDSSLIVDYDTNSGVYSGENVEVRLNDGSNESDVTVVGTPSWNGNEATFNISGEIGYDFAQDDTVVSTMVSLGSIETATSGWAETSASGTYDEATYPIVTYNRGTVTDTWTLTFSDATNFTVVGSNTGSVGSGDINTDFQPSISDSYYFKLDKDGWGGTWANGDTVVFTTTHAGYGLWLKEVVGAGIASFANNTVRFDWVGESA